MPAKVKVRIVAGRDLPVMDRASDLTDAFVEVKFGSTTHKTDVCRKSLNPQWNSDWYRFEVDDEDLQDEPLQIRVLDHDTYSAHDAIGKVYIDLNPLLSKEHGSVISGWFPIYDTMHGIRGELHVIVKVDLFSDFNKFRQSSCGVHFFCTSGIPHGYVMQVIFGFVEELVVNDDPEYQWIDKLRSQRASNEARQIHFTKLSGQLQRKIGLKVLEMGGNAVIGYRQCFDLEGESGVVVRGIGTSVLIAKLTGAISSPPSSSPIKDYPVPEDAVAPSSPNVTPTKMSTSPAKIAVPLGRRSSESDIGTPPKGSSLTGSSGSGSGGTKAPFHRPPLQQQSIDMLEYPFFTMKSFPYGFLVHIGGVVAARSVKLLDRIHNPGKDEPETRDAWWTELRTEIRSHARAMGCHAVVGYSEQTTICEEIIVLSATGTAAIVNLRSDPDSIVRTSLLTMSLDRSTFDREKDKERKLHVDVNLANQAAAHRMSQLSDGDDSGYIPQCSFSHIPYNESSLPYPVNLSHCCLCRRGKVPDMLFTTIEPQAEFPVVGKGCLIQARICRPKKEARGEANAKEISDSLPFMEYELHCQLQNKLKVKGMNALFGLKVQVVVGERMLVAVATATAVYAAAMPAPPLPKVLGKMENKHTESGLAEMRKKIIEAVNRNRDLYQLYPPENHCELSPRSAVVDVDSEDELADAEFSAGNKDTFILEIDDAEDAAVVQVLLDPPVPDGFEVCSTETMPGVGHLACNLQMFTRVWRGSLPQANNIAFASIFDSVLKSLFFKLRTMTPCCLCHLDFDVELHDEDDIQVSVTGICMGVGEPPSLTNGLVDIAPDAKDELHKNRHMLGDNDELMFTMDGVIDGSVSAPIMPDTTYPSLMHRTPSIPLRNLAPERRFRYYSGPKAKAGSVELTPLSRIPGGRIEYYLGHLNFFIIRETTSVRESGGLNGFMHSFIAEVMAICRAHVSSLGGNALVAYQLSECVLDDNLHKNQSQCLVNVCGDVVQLTYDMDGSNALQTQTSGSSSGGGPVVPQSVSPLIQEARAGRRGGGTPRSSPRNSPKSDRAARRTGFITTTSTTAPCS